MTWRSKITSARAADGGQLDRRADGYYRQPGFGGGGLTGGDAQQLHLQWPPSGIPRPALYHHTFYAVRHSGDRHLQLVPRQRLDKDPEFQKFISVPENHRYVYGDAATLLDRVLPRSNWIAMWIFLATIALVAVLKAFSDLRPSFGGKPLSMVW